MSEQLPPPDFNSQNYSRPNQDWVCGWDCEGRACKLGPSPNGQCRVTCECKPVLEKLRDETKGRWKCTRGKDQGGPCEFGPRPDGTCCRPLPRCTPARSLRAKRGRLTVAVCALTVGVLLLLLCGPARHRFINPGPVATHHTGKAFAEWKGASFGVAGFPEGHIACKAGKHTDWGYLREKIAAGADFVITQLFFDNEDFYEFHDHVTKKLGANVPIIPGLLPVLSRGQTKRFVALCGAALPEAFVSRLDELGDDDEAVTQFGIEYATKQCEALLKFGVNGLHFYTLNKPRSTVEIVRNLGLAK